MYCVRCSLFMYLVLVVSLFSSFRLFHVMPSFLYFALSYVVFFLFSQHYPGLSFLLGFVISVFIYFISSCDSSLFRYFFSSFVRSSVIALFVSSVRSFLLGFVRSLCRCVFIWFVFFMVCSRCRCFSVVVSVLRSLCMYVCRYVFLYVSLYFFRCFVMFPLVMSFVRLSFSSLSMSLLMYSFRSVCLYFFR